LSKFNLGEVTATNIALRARLYDDWTAQFVEKNLELPEDETAEIPVSITGEETGIVVLHLACGLDARPPFNTHLVYVLV
jgi:hypothetical protein